MSIPFGHETVTLVRRVETVTEGRTAVSYETIVLTGCSWRRIARLNRSENAALAGEEVTCRIPADQARPAAGDLLIRGEAAVTVRGGMDYQRLIEAYRGTGGAFVAASVADNARPGTPLPHYAVRG